MIKSYFDIEDVLAKEEVVPVRFVVPSFNMGKDVTTRSSEGENVSDEIKAGDVANLPLWAAGPLRRGGFVMVQTPVNYSLSTFREFKTDALAPNLRQKSPTFYETGLLLSQLIGNTTAGGHMSPEGSRLTAQIHRLYQLRYFRIIYSAAKKGFDLTDIKEKLTDSERYLLDCFLLNEEREVMWYSNPI